MPVDGCKIRQAREALKARTNGRQGSQSWLANKIGAHFTSVSRWESGTIEPSARHLRSLAEVLGVRIEDLYADTDDEETSLRLVPNESVQDMLRVLHELLGKAINCDERDEVCV